MRKYLVILLVLVIGFIGFQGIMSWNQSQVVEGEIILSLESTDFKFIPDEEVSRIMEDIYKAKLNESSFLGRYLPNYSKLSIVEILVNVLFMVGILVCLLRMGLLMKVLVILQIILNISLLLSMIYLVINSVLLKSEWFLLLALNSHLLWHSVQTVENEESDEDIKIEVKEIEEEKE